MYGKRRKQCEQTLKCEKCGDYISKAIQLGQVEKCSRMTRCKYCKHAVAIRLLDLRCGDVPFGARLEADQRLITGMAAMLVCMSVCMYMHVLIRMYNK